MTGGMAGPPHRHGSVVAVHASDSSAADPVPGGRLSQDRTEVPSDRRLTAGTRPSSCPPCSVSDLADRLGARRTKNTLATVSGVTLDSRLVRPNDLYVALPGDRTHGARFAAAAVDAGATAVLTDSVGAELLADDLMDKVLVVQDPRAAMATAAAEIYQRPAEKMIMLGVTGTAGKTTTTSLLAAGLHAAGYSCGLIGTLGYFLNGSPLNAPRTTVTTPESPDLQALLAVFAEQGAQAVAMEVSSHALALGRVDEICFDVAGFTNFGRDHLDFHGDEEAYFEAKAALFSSHRAHRAVINGDDPRGAELLRRRRAVGLPASYVRVPPSPDGAAVSGANEYRCTGVDLRTDPATVHLATPSGQVEFGLGLPGRYNVANASTALAILDQADVPIERAELGLADAVVPGRLQRVPLGSSAPRAFVDFAHTPQAVESVLTELAMTRSAGKLISVLGAGGERDPQKRGPMGAAAVRSCDVVIITDDNPRGEDPDTIRAAVLKGAHSAAQEVERDVQIIDGGDRRTAIREALQLAVSTDVVAVLGKGHERGQEVDGQMLPFDDGEEIATIWRQCVGDRVSPGMNS